MGSRIPSKVELGNKGFNWARARYIHTDYHPHSELFLKAYEILSTFVIRKWTRFDCRDGRSLKFDLICNFDSRTNSAAPPQRY
jgi:hypothetical protein